jgi:G3E family GTPase
MTIGHSIFSREVEFADVLVIKVDLVTDEQRALRVFLYASHYEVIADR